MVGKRDFQGKKHTTKVNSESIGTIPRSQYLRLGQQKVGLKKSRHSFFFSLLYQCCYSCFSLLLLSCYSLHFCGNLSVLFIFNTHPGQASCQGTNYLLSIKNHFFAILQFCSCPFFLLSFLITLTQQLKRISSFAPLQSLSRRPVTVTVAFYFLHCCSYQLS